MAALIQIAGLQTPVFCNGHGTQLFPPPEAGACTLNVRFGSGMRAMPLCPISSQKTDFVRKAAPGLQLFKLQAGACFQMSEQSP